MQRNCPLHRIDFGNRGVTWEVSVSRRMPVRYPLCWKRSSMREYAGVSGVDQELFCGLRIDLVPLPFDVHTHI